MNQFFGVTENKKSNEIFFSLYPISIYFIYYFE
jgi:hypothetical protein